MAVGRVHPIALEREDTANCQKKAQGERRDNTFEAKCVSFMSFMSRISHSADDMNGQDCHTVGNP